MEPDVEHEAILLRGLVLEDALIAHLAVVSGGGGPGIAGRRGDGRGPDEGRVLPPPGRAARPHCRGHGPPRLRAEPGRQRHRALEHDLPGPRRRLRSRPGCRAHGRGAVARRPGPAGPHRAHRRLPVVGRADPARALPAAAYRPLQAGSLPGFIGCLAYTPAETPTHPQIASSAIRSNPPGLGRSGSEELDREDDDHEHHGTPALAQPGHVVTVRPILPVHGLDLPGVLDLILAEGTASTRQ